MTAVTSSSVTISKVHVCLRPFFRSSLLLAMNFDGRRVKIEVREHLFCVFAASFICSVGHTFFKGDDMHLSSAFSSNQNPAHVLEKSLNSHNYTDRLDLYDGYRQSSTEISFKYNIFETFHRVFFHGSVVYKAIWRPGNPSSICHFFSFLFFSFFLFLFLFFFFGGGGRGGGGGWRRHGWVVVVCWALLFSFFLFFPLFDFPLFEFPLFPLLNVSLIFTRFCDTRISRY